MNTMGRIIAAHPTLFEKSEFSNDCPPGWEALVMELCAKLTAEHPNVRCDQCKSKFGGLRFYLNEPDEAAAAIIAEYEERSRRTCEVCGKLGRPRKKNSWIKTTCEEHADQ